MWIWLILFMLPAITHAETYEYATSPETLQIFREQWNDVAITLQRSREIGAQHARERQAIEHARRNPDPLPPEWEVNPRYMTPPSQLRDPEWFMLRTPSGALYYNYGGGMFQGPHGELYQAY